MLGLLPRDVGFAVVQLSSAGFPDFNVAQTKHKATCFVIGWESILLVVLLCKCQILASFKYDQGMITHDMQKV